MEVRIGHLRRIRLRGRLRRCVVLYRFNTCSREEMPMLRPRLLFLVILALLGVCSSGYLYAQAPQLVNISPTSVLPGMQVTLTGTGFGETQGPNTGAVFTT